MQHCTTQVPNTFIFCSHILTLLDHLCKPCTSLLTALCLNCCLNDHYTIIFIKCKVPSLCSAAVDKRWAAEGAATGQLTCLLTHSTQITVSEWDISCLLRWMLIVVNCKGLSRKSREDRVKVVGVTHLTFKHEYHAPGLLMLQIYNLIHVQES